MRSLFKVFFVLAFGLICIDCASKSPYVTGGIIDMQQSRYESAEIKFKQALEIEPENSDAHMWLGKSYASQRKFTKAADCFDKAISIDSSQQSEFEREPRYFWAIYYNSSMDFIEDENWDSAGKRLLTTICIIPDSAGPHTQLSYVYTKQGKGKAGTIATNVNKEKQRQRPRKFKCDFRKTNWGMSKVQVKKTEKTKPVDENRDAVVYKTKVGGLDCLASYFFIEGKLVSGVYMFTHAHTNKNDYISDYTKLKELLTKKYGKPVKEGINWKNELFKNEPQSWGLAISIGHLVYFSVWETTTSEIRLGLYGDNYEIKFGVVYDSKKAQELQKKSKEEKAFDEF